MSKQMGLSEITELLTENLNEELAAAAKIMAAAEPILKAAASEPEQAKEPKTGKGYSDKKSKADESNAASVLKR
jgi:hypothetical protein